MNVKLSQVREGSIVVVYNTGNGYVRGTVIETLTDVKNGIPGIDYELDNGQGYWAYIDQIQSVVQY